MTISLQTLTGQSNSASFEEVFFISTVNYFGLTLNENQIEKLFTLSKIQEFGGFSFEGRFWLVVVCRYLTGNFKNSFDLSFKDQIKNWLEDSNTDYPTPLSFKQWKYAKEISGVETICKRLTEKVTDLIDNSRGTNQIQFVSGKRKGRLSDCFFSLETLENCEGSFITISS